MILHQAEKTVYFWVLKMLISRKKREKKSELDQKKERKKDVLIIYFIFCEIYAFFMHLCILFYEHKPFILRWDVGTYNP